MVRTRDNSNIVLVLFILAEEGSPFPPIVDVGLIPNTLGLPAVVPVPVPVPVPGVEPGEPVDGVVPALLQKSQDKYISIDLKVI